MPKLGGLMELTRENIDNDFNIAMIREKINKDFGTKIGRISRIIKVMYQATDRLLYIITLETMDKNQYTYRTIINQDGNIDSITPEANKNSSNISAVTTTSSSSVSSNNAVTSGGKLLTSSGAEIDASTQQAILYAQSVE